MGRAIVDEKELQREIDFIISGIKGFASVIESELGQANWETKLGIIIALVRRIEIDHDNVHIVFRFQELTLVERQKKMFNIVPGILVILICTDWII